MSLTSPVATEIKVFRKGMGLSQARFAELIGASTRAVEEWEGGRRPAPPMLRLAMAALINNLAPYDLAGRDGERIMRPAPQ